MFTYPKGLPGFLVRSKTPSNVPVWLMIFTAIASLLCGAANSASATPPEKADYGKVPLSFQPNLGQAAEEVQFQSQGPGYSLYLTPDQVVLKLERQHSASASSVSSSDTLRMRLLGSSGTASVVGLDPLPGIVNYFIGNDPSRWYTGIPTYGKVSKSGIYPGIDLVFYGNQRQLEYDFVVNPGADPARIAWQIDGAKPQLVAGGVLELNAPGGPVKFLTPLAYQVIAGKRTTVAAAFHVTGDSVYFDLGPYDRSQTLVIDPVLNYFSYLGGNGIDYIGNNSNISNISPQPTEAVGIDALGDLYVAGSTTSTDFPLAAPVLTEKPKQISESWAFVSKFNPTGSKLLYSTYIGGSTGGNDAAYAVAVDSAGNAYVAGDAGTNDFPVTAGAFQTICAPVRDNNTGKPVATCTFNTGNGNYSVNAFVLKLNPAGSTLVYSSFLGGYAVSHGAGIAVDHAGQAYVTGTATSSLCGGGVYSYGAQYECFPTTTNALISDIGGGNSIDMAYMSVLNSTGSKLVYSTLFGDSQGAVSVKGAGCTIDCSAGTYGSAIALDPSGNVYIGGRTISSHMVLTAGAYNTKGSGPNPGAPTQLAAPNGYGYVAKFKALTTAGATALVYSTYFGGGSAQGGNVGGLAADSAGNTYIAGSTFAPDFPATKGAIQTQCDVNEPVTFCVQDGYVAKLNPAGTGLIWATYLGSGSDAPIAFLGPILVDSAQDVYVMGSGTGQLPLGGGKVSSLNGANTVYVAKINSTGTKVVSGSTVGGPGNGTEMAGGMAIDSAGDIYVGGSIAAGGSFATPGAFQQGYAGGGWDGFVAKLTLEPTTTTVALSTATTTFGQQITFTATVTGTTQKTPVPTGEVTLTNGATILGTITLGSTGAGIFSTSSLAPGTYSVIATYSGDAEYRTSTSTAHTLTVNKATPKVSVASSLNPSTYGVSVTFTATVAPVGATGTVTFKNGTATLGTSTLSAGIAKFSTAALIGGTHSITASYAGNADYLPITSSALTQAVSKITPKLTVTSLPVTYNGAAHAVTISSSVAGTISSVHYSGSATLPVKAGTYAITANFTPANTADYNSLIEASAGSFVIKKATPTLKVTNSPAIYNGAGHAATISGSVAGTASKVLYSGSATVPFKAGTYAITASFIPTDTTDYNSLTAVSAGSFVINKATPTLKVTNSPAIYNGAGHAATISGSVAGTASKVLYSGSATVPIKAGTYAITASFIPTDTTDYNSLTAVSAGSFVINKATPAITLASSLNPSTHGASVKFTAKLPATATGTVTFKDGAASLGITTLSGGTATYATTLLATGKHTITAIYGGDSNDNAATSSALTQTVN